MQTNLKRGKAASRVRSVGLSVAIVASASIVATFSFFVPNPALAACGARAIRGRHAAIGQHRRSYRDQHRTRRQAQQRRRRRKPRLCKRKQRLGIAGPADGRFGQGGRGRRACGAPGDAREDRDARTTNATAHLHTVKPAHHA